jgi:hypothetical protein
MRKINKKVSDEETIGFLKKGQTIHLALTDGNTPYCVPMSYGYKDGAIYMHCAHEGRKIDMINKNPLTAFTVVADSELIKKETSCGWTIHFESVMGEGRIEILSDDGEKRSGLDAIMEHYGRFENSYPDEILGRTCVLKLTIDSCVGKKSPAPSKGA